VVVEPLLVEPAVVEPDVVDPFVVSAGSGTGPTLAGVPILEP
jgi:hypothetical protein